jgi:hypothetical protein
MSPLQHVNVMQCIFFIKKVGTYNIRNNIWKFQHVMVEFEIVIIFQMKHKIC